MVTRLQPQWNLIFLDHHNDESWDDEHMNIDVHFGTAGADGLGLNIANTLNAILAFVSPSRPISMTILSFPGGPDCCCPEDVACLHRSADGHYYVASKGVQKRS